MFAKILNFETFVKFFNLLYIIFYCKCKCNRVLVKVAKLTKMARSQPFLYRISRAYFTISR